MRARPGVSAEGRAHGGGVDVLERSASKDAREGDILFGRVATLGEVSMLYGCGSHGFPPDYKPSIIALRKWMRRAAGRSRRRCCANVRPISGRHTSI